MRLLLRIVLLVPIALVFAVPAGTLFLFFAGLTDPTGRALAGAFIDATAQVIDEAMAYGDPDATAGAIFYGLWQASLMILLVPPAVTGLLGEIIGTRAYLWYALAAGALAAAMPWVARASAGGADIGVAPGELRLTALLFLTGVVSGSVMWLVQGQSAGRPPAAPPPGLPAVRG